MVSSFRWFRLFRFGRFGRFGGFVVSMVSAVSFRSFRFDVSPFSTCPIITRWGTCAPGEYRFRHILIVDRQSPIVVDSHKIEY